MAREIPFRIIDIGVNLTDPMFQGIYRDKTFHEGDIEHVLERSKAAGLDKIILTGTNLKESIACLELIEKYKQYPLYCTIGVHPTRCSDFESENDPIDYENRMVRLIQDNMDKVVAVGECGLDYARLQFCPRETQIKYFKKQFDWAEKFNLPLFLHSRDTQGELLQIVRENRLKFSTGVVHSYDGSLEEALELIELGLYIGINGCSIKTEKNIEVLSQLPLDKLMIETDAPWCEVRATHLSYPILLKSIMNNPSFQPLKNFPIYKKEKYVPGSMVKFRNEPCCVLYILHIVAEVHQRPIEEVAEILYNTTHKVFFENSENTLAIN